MNKFKNTFLMALLAGSVVFTSCGPGEERDSNDEKDHDEIIREIEEEARQERQEEVEHALDRLSELTAELERMGDEKTEEMKERRKEVKAKLKESRETLSYHLSSLRDEGDDVYQDLIAEIKDALEYSKAALGDKDKDKEKEKEKKEEEKAY